MTMILAALAMLQSGAVAVPPSAIARAAPDGGVQVTVQIVRAKDREMVPFEYVRNTIMIQAQLGGQAGWMVIDTGAQHSVIDTGLAKQIGASIIPMRGQITAAGGHPVPKQRVDDVALVIPHLFSVRMPMLAIDLQLASRAAGRRIVGIVGDDLLSNMVMGVDRREGRIILIPGGKMTLNCPAPCKNGAPKPIPLMRINTARGPVEQIAATIGGKVLRLALDTGSDSGLSLTPAAWQRVKPEDAQIFARHSVGASGVTDEVQASRLPKVLLGDVEVDDVDVQIRPWDSSYGDGILGMGILARYSIIMDIKAGQLFLIRADAAPSSLPAPVFSKP